MRTSANDSEICSPSEIVIFAIYSINTHVSNALTKLEVTRGSLTVPSQTAAVQKRLAADIALLRATALVPHMKDEV